ncbi:MAG: LytR C-terminal domain-containing protein [Candidatus Pacebacteria bacterium]|jgi:hypothetical protein|nr:LytR C-terminal domain-containing protein [Candidatus Paceibacterota bacterium]
MTETTPKTLKERLSEIKPKDLLYPGIILLFIIIVVIIFFLVTRFITNNINKAFSGDTGGESRTLNIDNYNLVAKKLGISITPVKSEITNEVTNATTTQETNGSAQATTTTLDKKTLTLQILNSTTKKGVAGTLAKTLEGAGFAKATTGNQSKLIPVTTIYLKESVASFGPELLEEVKKSYSSAVATTTQETKAFDISIVIGTK